MTSCHNFSEALETMNYIINQQCILKSSDLWMPNAVYVLTKFLLTCFRLDWPEILLLCDCTVSLFGEISVFASGSKSWKVSQRAESSNTTPLSHAYKNSSQSTWKLSSPGPHSQKLSQAATTPLRFLASFSTSCCLEQWCHRSWGCGQGYYLSIQKPFQIGSPFSVACTKGGISCKAYL